MCNVPTQYLGTASLFRTTFPYSIKVAAVQIRVRFPSSKGIRLDLSSVLLIHSEREDADFSRQNGELPCIYITIRDVL
jgi:hypothetical protein